MGSSSHPACPGSLCQAWGSVAGRSCWFHAGARKAFLQQAEEHRVRAEPEEGTTCAPRALLLSLGGSAPRLPRGPPAQPPCSAQGACKRLSALCGHVGDKRSPPSVPGPPPLFLKWRSAEQPSWLCSGLPRSQADPIVAPSRLCKACRSPWGSSAPALFSEVVPHLPLELP